MCRRRSWKDQITKICRRRRSRRSCKHKLIEWFSTSMLKAAEGSDTALIPVIDQKLISDCVNSAAKTCQNRRGGSWVEPLPITEKISRYAWLIRPCITTNWQCLRWAVSVSRALPPCNIHWDIKCWSFQEYRVWMRTPKQMKKFYICADVSHTHNFVTHAHTPHHVSLPYTIFHIQLCHALFFLLLDPPPTPLSLLPSPPRSNKHLLVIIGRSWLVRFSGPFIKRAMLSRVLGILQQETTLQTATRRQCGPWDSTEKIAHKKIWWIMLLVRSFYIDKFTHRSFHTHTQRLLHREAFTQSGSWTQRLLHREVFIQTGFYTQKLLHREKSLHRGAFTHRSVYTEKSLH